MEFSTRTQARLLRAQRATQNVVIAQWTGMALGVTLIVYLCWNAIPL